MAIVEYDGSEAFMADMNALGASLLKAKEILAKPEFANWILATEQNFDCPGVVAQFEEIQELVGDTNILMDQFEDIINNAE